MYELPTCIILEDGQSFTIRNHGDFRMVLDCFICLNDDELSDQEKSISCIIIFYEQFNDISDLINIPEKTLGELAHKMSKFFNCNQPEYDTGIKHPRVIDWQKDSMMICSAINNVARTEVRALPYLHWWTFMGYYMSISDSLLSTVTSIRSKIAKGKKLEKHEKEFKAENPQYFNYDFRTNEQKKLDNVFKNLWNN